MNQEKYSTNRPFFITNSYHQPLLRFFQYNHIRVGVTTISIQGVPLRRIPTHTVARRGVLRLQGITSATRPPLIATSMGRRWVRRLPRPTTSAIGTPNSGATARTPRYGRGRRELFRWKV